MEVLAVIPARGGSKGLPRKNLRELLGKPLLGYSIEAALESRTITRTVVSTDSEEIAALAQQLGAEVPFLRPERLAADETPMIDVISHALEVLYPGFRNGPRVPDWVIVLQPTSPLRSHKHIDAAFSQLFEMDGDSLASVCAAKESPFWMFRVDTSGFLRPILSRQVFRRQDLPPVFRLNGAIYITQPTLVAQRRLLGQRIVPFFMAWEESVDIDNEEDLRLAEYMLKIKMKSNRCD
ncbi:acylneuraminate cytidylyltransferase family protein [Thermaerobacter sp. PB12/4term]|nr:acylneuraminate cytidylyltransferase family protein [Thermaerobacter sp. PB12/4term]